MEEIDQCTWMPYLTEQGHYIYVNQNMEQQLKGCFHGAAPFLNSGYALVSNGQNKHGVIDRKGIFVVGYTHQEVRLQLVDGLTICTLTKEYEKKMSFWKWQYNILGGAVNKTKTFVSLHSFVLETRQTLFRKKAPYLSQDFFLYAQELGKGFMVFNYKLYQKKGQRFVSRKSCVELVLEQNRFIVAKKDKWQIYSTLKSKPLADDLVAQRDISLQVNAKPLVMRNMNHERFGSGVAKVLYSPKSQELYVYPQYDKAFPKSLHHLTPLQVEFVQQASWVCSVYNSAYFILGRFNFDQNIWAFDWLYVDQNGRVYDHIEVDTFNIVDQVGRVVWPSKDMLFTPKALQDIDKIATIKYLGFGSDFYQISTEKQGQIKQGVWDNKNKKWLLAPMYHTIVSLDLQRQLFALQQSEGDKFYLYDNLNKAPIADQGYTHINSSAKVSVDLGSNKVVSFFIDPLKAKQYSEIHY